MKFLTEFSKGVNQEFLHLISKRLPCKFIALQSYNDECHCKSGEENQSLAAHCSSVSITQGIMNLVLTKHEITAYFNVKNLIV